MEKNDFRRLKDEADIESVVNYLGLETTRRGSAFFILCPIPTHEDHKATNCYFKPGWNNVYCKACGKSTNAIDLIMYTRGCSYGEAADILWEVEGKPDWYYKKAQKQKNFFSLKKEEADLIGVHYPGRLLAPYRLDETKETLPRQNSYESTYIEGYLACTVNHFTWNDFMSKAQYEAMVYNKTVETIRKIKVLIRNCDSISDPEMKKGFLECFSEQKKMCNAILLRLKK